MKKKVVFLWLFVFFTMTTTYSQNLTISSTGYNQITCTDGVVNVRSGTEVTIVATLPSGASATYWTASPVLTATNPAQSFPITAPAANTVSFLMPSIYDEVVIVVYFNTTPMTNSWVKLVRNDNVATGLFAGQNIQGCSGTDYSFAATNPYQTGFLYNWQEYNGSSWVVLGSGSYYSAVGHVLNVQANSSIQGKRFKCVVTNPNCLGAIDETGEILVGSVYALPQIQTYTVNTVNYCPGLTPSLHLNGSQSGFTYQLQNWGTTTNVGAPVTGTGGAIDIPWPAGDYQLIITDPSTNCKIKN